MYRELEVHLTSNTRFGQGAASRETPFFDTKPNRDSPPAPSHPRHPLWGRWHRRLDCDAGRERAVSGTAAASRARVEDGVVAAFEVEEIIVRSELCDEKPVLVPPDFAANADGAAFAYLAGEGLGDAVTAGISCLFVGVVDVGDGS
jgi:hypothetical protein